MRCARAGYTCAARAGMSICTLLLFLFAAPQSAAPGPSTSAPEGARLLVEELDGKRAALELPPGERFDWKAGANKQLGPARLRVQRPQPALRAQRTDDALVFLHDGERLQASLSPSGAENLDLTLAGGAAASLSVDDLRGLYFPLRGAAKSAWQQGPPAAGDLLHWMRGAGLDRIEGTLVAFSAAGVDFEGKSLGRRVYPWGEIAALFVEPLGRAAQAESQPSELPEVEVDLRDGSRLRARLVELTATALSLEHARLGALRFDLGAVAELVSIDPRWTFASALPLEFDAQGEGTPFHDGLGLSFAPKVDLNVLGGALSAGGASHARGLGVHAPSRVKIALDLGYRQLVGEVAVDDSARLLSHPGSVKFQVYADGALLWQSAIVAAGDAPQALSGCELAGKRELVLVVEDGGDGHVADRANWLGLRLIR